MSGLFNLRVGGAEAEDIICNGQTVEEVWVDGTRVFDAYDPQAVPNGTMNFSSVSRSFATSYNEAQNGLEVTSVNGQVGATGSIYLRLDGCDTRGTDIAGRSDRDQGYTIVDAWGNPTSMGLYVSATLDVCYSGGGSLFTIGGYSRPNYGGASPNELYASGGRIVQESAGYHGSMWAKVEWNFKTRKYTTSGSNGFTTVTNDFSEKWRPGMYIRLRAWASSSSNGYWINSGNRSNLYDMYGSAYLNATASN